MTYQHGLPFNQRVERKDKVKPCSQHRHSENVHRSGAMRGRRGLGGVGAAGPAPPCDRRGGKGEDVLVRPGRNT